MREHIINILKEVAANPPSMEEIGKKADLIIELIKETRTIVQGKSENNGKNKKEKQS